MRNKTFEVERTTLIQKWNGPKKERGGLKFLIQPEGGPKLIRVEIKGGVQIKMTCRS